jgi:hypothetical protein
MLIFTSTRVAALTHVSGTAPIASPSANPDRIVEPLREIGHVKATSDYCASIQRNATTAATTAIAYELGLYKTANDFQAFKLDNGLSKSKSVRLLELDLHYLTDLANAGRGELKELGTGDTTASDQQRSALVGLRDALDGAKARQFELARHIAKIVGFLAERPTYSIINLPGESLGDPDAFLLSNDFLDTQEDAIHSAALQGLFELGPEDEVIASDLERAANYATLAVSLGGC